MSLDQQECGNDDMYQRRGRSEDTIGERSPNGRGTTQSPDTQPPPRSRSEDTNGTQAKPQRPPKKIQKQLSSEKGKKVSIMHGKGKEEGHGDGKSVTESTEGQTEGGQRPSRVSNSELTDAEFESTLQTIDHTALMHLARQQRSKLLSLRVAHRASQSSLRLYRAKNRLMGSLKELVNVSIDEAVEILGEVLKEILRVRQLAIYFVTPTEIFGLTPSAENDQEHDPFLCRCIPVPHVDDSFDEDAPDDDPGLTRGSSSERSRSSLCSGPATPVQMSHRDSPMSRGKGGRDSRNRGSSSGEPSLERPSFSTSSRASLGQVATSMARVLEGPPTPKQPATSSNQQTASSTVHPAPATPTRKAPPPLPTTPRHVHTPPRRPRRTPPPLPHLRSPGVRLPPLIDTGADESNKGGEGGEESSESRGEAPLVLRKALSVRLSLQNTSHKPLLTGSKLVASEWSSVASALHAQRCKRDAIRATVPGLVAYTGQSVFLTDLEAESRYDMVFDRQHNLNAHNCICAAIKEQDGTVVGVVQGLNIAAPVDLALLEQLCAMLQPIISAYMQDAILDNMHSTQSGEQARLVSLLESYQRNFVAQSYEDRHLQFTRGKKIDSLTIPRSFIKDKDMEKLYSPSFNCWDYSENDLVRFSVAMFQDLGLISAFQIDMTTLQNFLQGARMGYNQIPYHNWYHAFSVLQFIFMILKTTRARTYISSPQEVLSLIVASICHDMDHGGFTNSFEVMFETQKAMVYNDQNVLENHHAHSMFRLLQCDGGKCNIFAGIPHHDYRKIRQIMIEAILGTDMAQHSEEMHRLERIIRILSPTDSKLKAMLGHESVVALHSLLLHKKDEKHPDLVNILLHSADLSAQTSSWRVARMWENRICAEMKNQATISQRLQIPVPAYMQNLDDVQVRAKQQVGFIDFVLAPWWRNMSKLLPELEPCYETLMRNRKKYAFVKETGGTKRVSLGEDLKIPDKDRLKGDALAVGENCPRYIYEHMPGGGQAGIEHPTAPMDASLTVAARPKVVMGSTFESYMEKMGEKEKRSGWKLRYFVAFNTKLLYYKTVQTARQGKPLGEIPLGMSTVFEWLQEERLGKEAVYSLTLKNGKGRRYLFTTVEAAHQDEVAFWSEHLSGTCGSPGTSM